MNLFHKIIAWINHEVLTVEHWLSKEEGQLILLLKPLFSKAEAAAILDLKHFISGVLLAGADFAKSQDLATLEATVLNKLEVASEELKEIATALGSNALQVLIGLVLAEIKPVPAKASLA